jgi:hypothetical protein
VEKTTRRLNPTAFQDDGHQSLQRREEVLEVALLGLGDGLGLAVSEQLVDLQHQRVDALGRVHADPHRAEKVELGTPRLQGLIQVLPLEPEVGRARVGDLSYDQELELQREDGSLQRDPVPDLPALLVERVASDEGAVAIAPEVLELCGIQLPVRPDLADGLGLDGEVGEGHPLLLFDHAPEPRPARGRRDTR